MTPIVRDNDPRRPGKPMVRSVSFRLEEETDEKLTDLCYREGISKSALLKRLVRQYVEENYNND